VVDQATGEDITEQVGAKPQRGDRGERGEGRDRFDGERRDRRDRGDRDRRDSAPTPEGADQPVVGE
jgi:polyribonucleotide nucleotidyltransferase